MVVRDVFGIVGTTQAGVFEVTSVVAVGGFGVVYRARHKSFRADTALKCLKVPDAMTEAERAAFLEKFREEGELLFRLSAQIPEVVRPLHVDALTLGDQLVPFLALEWLEGESLDALIRGRAAKGKAPLALQKAVKLLGPIARALSKAHELPTEAGPVSVIHRDLKPENIFVLPTGHVKILDFGIARAKRAATEGRVTTAGDVLSAFTPGYAAPEQWSPKEFGPAGPWTDVYGLAMTMVETLAGKPPFEGEIAQLMFQALDARKRPTPRTSGVVVSDGVESAFRRALAVDPKLRTQTVEAFWTEIERAIGAPSAFVQGDESGVQLESIAPPPKLSASDFPDLDLAPRLARSSAPTSASPAKRADPSIPTLSLSAAAKLGGADDPPRRSPRVAPVVPLAVPQKNDLDDDDDKPLALVLAGPPPSSPASHRARPPISRPLAPNLAPLAPEDDGPSVGATLRGPLRVFFAAVAVAALDMAWVRLTGERLLIADIRPMVVAGPLAVFALIFALFRLVTR